MNPWPFVIAAYAVALLGTAGLLLLSYFAMRRSEAQADRLRSDDR
jgi:hypothetical protein